MQLFIFLSFFDLTPKYHFRIAFIFIGTSFLITMIILFYFNEHLKVSLIKIIKRQTNIIRVANRINKKNKSKFQCCVLYIFVSSS
jgi:hypothetical protein